MLNLKMFPQHDYSPAWELRREVAEIRSTQSLLAQFRPLIAANTDATAASKFKLFDEICEGYENIAMPKGEFGRVAITLDSECEASLCSSIDELLDQLACLRTTSRLWDVKASLVCTQISDFASRRQARLENVLLSNTPQADLKTSPRFAAQHRLAQGHQVSV